jgi:hypothetical protein
MPGCARREIIDESKPGMYHCFNRCVRRAFLFGDDPCSGKNYDYRKTWLYQLLVELAAIFAIDICKYAILDNHFHLLVRNRPDVAKKWSDRKILLHAIRLFPAKFKLLGVTLDEPLPLWLLQDKKLIEQMRKRLSSISWLMKVLSERIAKRANREDGVTGHFWAGRFKCERICDLVALLACSMYIDLNLVRAGVAKTPETSRFTSAYDRIQGLKQRSKTRRPRKDRSALPDRWLCPLKIDGDVPQDNAAELGLRCSNKGLFDMGLPKYLSMLDWTGRELRKDKRGAIPAHLAPILERLGIDESSWVESVAEFGRWFRRAVGTVASLRAEAERVGRRWIRGVGRAAQIYGSDESE